MSLPVAVYTPKTLYPSREGEDPDSIYRHRALAARKEYSNVILIADNRDPHEQDPQAIVAWDPLVTAFRPHTLTELGLGGGPSPTTPKPMISYVMCMQGQPYSPENQYGHLPLVVGVSGANFYPIGLFNVLAAGPFTSSTLWNTVYGAAYTDPNPVIMKVPRESGDTDRRFQFTFTFFASLHTIDKLEFTFTLANGANVLGGPPQILMGSDVASIEYGTMRQWTWTQAVGDLSPTWEPGVFIQAGVSALDPDPPETSLYRAYLTIAEL